MSGVESSRFGDGLATRLVHSDYVAPGGFGGLNTPVHHASTVTFENVAALRLRDWRREDAYTYGLHGTPTTFTLENRLAEIEGGRHTLLAPSGLAAISLIDLALLRGGDEVLIPDNVYQPSRELAAGLLADFGVTTRVYDPLIGAGIDELITSRTRLLWLEAPGSVSMEVPDIPAMVKVARQRGVITAIDNTWAGGLLFRPFEHDIDIAMHALTKYPSGGSDVLMGSVTTVDSILHERLKLTHMRLGLGCGPEDVFLVLRGLTSLKLRLDRHGASGLALAHWLKGREEVVRVLHPALADCPGHEFWKRDFSGSGGLFSVVFRADIASQRVDAMIDALRLFLIGYSWGGATSLVVPYDMQRSRTVVPWTAEGALVRFYVGLEDPQDLIADLDQAFQNF